MRGRTTKYLMARFDTDDCEVRIYGSGGVLHTVVAMYSNGNTHLRNCKGWPAARSYADQLVQENTREPSNAGN